VHNVLDACISITWGSGKGVGPWNSRVFVFQPILSFYNSNFRHDSHIPYTVSGASDIETGSVVFALAARPRIAYNCELISNN
jgi:hypothetical protein